MTTTPLNDVDTRATRAASGVPSVQGTALYSSNPLPRALAHYERELAATLGRIGVEHRVLPTKPVEGGVGISAKARMLRNAAENGRSGGRLEQTAMQLWPSLGLLDPLIWRSGSRSGSTNAVIVHDPVPLRSQIGFDRVSRSLARRSGSGRSPVIVSHSDDAMVVSRELFPRFRHVKLLHPVLASPSPVPRASEPTVVVAGQYKPQRDLALLARLGQRLRREGVVGEIYGRGWPDDLPGWRVTSRFLDEDELDRALASAWCVLIPYQLYFQSGIALRALELGTLSVSPHTSFASDLLGAGSSLMTDSSRSDEEFARAIASALAGEHDPAVLLERYVEAVDRSWMAGLDLIGGAEHRAGALADPPIDGKA